MTEQLHPDVAATAKVLASIRVELAKKQATPSVEPNAKVKPDAVPSK